MRRNPSRLLVLLLPLALCIAASQASPARADLSCSDCIELCILNQCGFVQDPQCVADSSGPCQADCAAAGYC